jgi:sulfite exporter TauE/SafE
MILLSVLFSGSLLASSLLANPEIISTYVISPWVMIGAGFSLGLVHALDADHVMAVSALSNRKNVSVLKTVSYCLKWAAGHGAVLLLVGLLFFGLGFELPASLLSIAEASIGVLLVVIGVFCLGRIRKQKLKLHVHQHGDVTHTHWLVQDDSKTKNHEAHTPTMVGMLHGLAGSAPALALIPFVSQGASSSEQLGVAVIYLIVFSIGVLLAMALFGLGLGAVQQKLRRFNIRFFQWSQYLIAVGAILLGGFWLSQSL